jgi:hypothetical protein
MLAQLARQAHFAILDGEQTRMQGKLEKNDLKNKNLYNFDSQF